MATSISSDLQAASVLLFTGRNRINAVTLLADGTNAATAIVYDNTAGSGKVVAKVFAKAGESTQHVIFENPVLCENGIYLSLTGTGAGAIVYFGG